MWNIVAENIDVIAVVMVLVSVVPWGIEYLKHRRNKKADAGDGGDGQDAAVRGAAASRGRGGGRDVYVSCCT